MEIDRLNCWDLSVSLDSLYILIYYMLYSTLFWFAADHTLIELLFKYILTN